MVYSKSLQALKRVIVYLDEMLDAQGRVEWSHAEPAKLAFQIREGIKVAKDNALDKDKLPREPFAAYAKLSGKYIIRCKGSRVIADPRDVIPLQMVREKLNKMVLRELVDELEILGALIEHHADEMYFPDADLDINGELALYNWAVKNGYSLVPNETGITLTKHDVGDLAWKP